MSVMRVTWLQLLNRFLTGDGCVPADVVNTSAAAQGHLGEKVRVQPEALSDPVQASPRGCCCSSRVTSKVL